MLSYCLDVRRRRCRYFNLWLKCKPKLVSSLSTSASLDGIDITRNSSPQYVTSSISLSQQIQIKKFIPTNSPHPPLPSKYCSLKSYILLDNIYGETQSEINRNLEVELFQQTPNETARKSSQFWANTPKEVVIRITIVA